MEEILDFIKFILNHSDLRLGQIISNYYAQKHDIKFMYMFKGQTVELPNLYKLDERDQRDGLVLDAKVLANKKQGKIFVIETDNLSSITDLFHFTHE